MLLPAPDGLPQTRVCLLLRTYRRYRKRRADVTRRRDALLAAPVIDRLALSRLTQSQWYADQEMDRAEEELRAIGYTGVLF